MTIAFVLLWLAAVAPTASPRAGPAPCTCASAPATNGWCEAHRVGYVAGVAIRSSVLYETLDAHGHAVDPQTFECVACQAAIRTSGFCETHRIGFEDSLAYFSRLTYELARARRAPAGAIACPVCRMHAVAGGWCDACRIGRLGRFVFDDKQALLRVLREMEILRAANEASARCEGCAAAMVTDTQCPYCRITYQGGRALAPAP